VELFSCTVYGPCDGPKEPKMDTASPENVYLAVPVALVVVLRQEGRLTNVRGAVFW
jgi:hypothetical protein